MIAYPRYESSTPVFQIEEFTLSQYGLPPVGDYIKDPDDDQRKQVRFPLDPNQKSCMVTEEKFSQIDNYMKDQTKFFKGVLSKTKFEYSPIVREPIVNIDGVVDESKKKKIEKCKYWKAKLDVDFDSGKILTTVFVRDPENPKAPAPFPRTQH